MKETKTVREIVTDAGADPETLTMETAGNTPVFVETPGGKTRLVTGAWFDGYSLTLSTGK